MRVGKNTPNSVVSAFFRALFIYNTFVNFPLNNKLLRGDCVRMAKQRGTSSKVKLKESDLFIRTTPPDVIKASLKLRNKACNLTIQDISRAFTI